jgi:hypothetical protein
VKSLSFKELDLIVERAQNYSGAVLEDVVLNNDILLLLLKKSEQKIFFIVDLKQKPFFLVSEHGAPGLKKQIKPLILFLKAHFLGSVFESALVQKEYGRFVRLHFSENREMELHLFPQARNIIVRHNKSQISLNKVNHLQKMGEVKEDPAPRSPQEVYDQWLDFFRKPSTKKLSNGETEKKSEKIVEKKKQGLRDLEKKMIELKSSVWDSLAHWLSQNRTLDVPREFIEFVDLRQSLTWNIEKAFTQAKQIKSKLKVVEERQRLLLAELEELSKNPQCLVVTPSSSKKESTAIEGAKGRTKIINESIRAYIGKSAEDNLKILRKSKAWHLWLHIKDLPGSHGIIAFNKSVNVPQEVLREVALWVIEQSLSPKQKESWRGIKCEVLYCECRFVTPIRGDKLGRVNYKNEKVLSVIIP